jgi:SAM-dependent methyltransferase
MFTNEATPLYRDGPHYDAMHSVLPFTDTPFYVEESKRARGPVLELACGTGRLTIPIAQSGVEITGLDLSPSMLAHARRKASEAQARIEWVEGDCRTLALKRKFALIFMPFHSMQHMHDAASLEALFANVRRHLAEGGRFIFDVFNPSIAILSRDPKQRHVDRKFEDPGGRGTVTLETTAVYDDATQVNHIKMHFSVPGENDYRVEPLSLRCFFPQELDLLVRHHGFEIERKYGNFERKPFAGGDMKQIVVCR